MIRAWYNELSEGSLEKPVSSAIYFYDAGSSAVAELIGIVYQAGREECTQRAESNPREGPGQRPPGDSKEVEAEDFLLWKLP